MMLHYKIILYRSEEDQAFIAKVPELPGCAADGSTKKYLSYQLIQH